MLLTPLHYLQRAILRSLSRSDDVTYAQLRPNEITHNLFSYHLRQLTGQGLVEKSELGYRLSATGQQYVSHLTRTSLELLPQPRLYSLLVISNEAAQYAMHRRDGQPFRGRYTFPGGAIELNEPTTQHLDRQLAEKLGIPVPLKHALLASVMHHHNGETLAHAYLHIFTGSVKGNPQLQALDNRFSPEWVNPNHLRASDIMPDIEQLLAVMAQPHSPSFFEFETHT
jgi:ADP-ribose pyrophosphatase YjhB (NUDIX family)